MTGPDDACRTKKVLADITDADPLDRYRRWTPAPHSLVGDADRIEIINAVAN